MDYVLNRNYGNSIFRCSKKVVWILAISLLCIAVGVVTTPYLSLIAFFLFGFSLLVLQPEDILVLLFGLLPFANIFKLSPTSMSCFTLCEIIAVIWLLLSCKKIKVSQFVVILCLVAYMLIFSFENSNVFTIFKLCINCFIIVISVSTFTKEGFTKSIRLLAISTIVMMILSSNVRYLEYVEKYFTDLDYYVDSTGSMTDTLRISGFFGDPNYCAVLIILVLSALCILYYYKSIGVEFWIYVLFLAPLGFLTYSKSYFLCMIIWAVALIFFVLLPKHKCLAGISIIAVGFVFYLAYNGKIEAINMVIERFNHGDITTGRTELNKQYLQYIFDNGKVLLFGDGVTADRFVGARNNVHCLYIEMLYKLGILGSLLYCGTMMSLLPSIKVRTEHHFVNYLPLIFFLLMFAFLAAVVNYALPFYIAIVYLTFNYAGLDSFGSKEVLR